MWKKVLIALVGVILVVGSIVYAKLGQFQAMGEAAANMKPPPEVVTAMTTTRDSWRQSMPAVGTLAAVQGVTVSAEVGGRVKTIQFESGAEVQAGDPLLQLDTTTEAAQLRSAEAAAGLANANLARSRELGKQRLVSKAEIDTARALAREAAAQVQIAKSTLSLKTIRAPFAGRLGLRQVNIGEVLKSGDPIVSLQTLDPIYANFSLPQQQLGQLAVGMSVQLRSDAVPGKQFEGRINAISPEVDPLTRNARVQAQVANPDGKLNAGMFVQLEVLKDEQLPVLAIAASAILYAPYGNSVFVIEQAQTKDGQDGVPGLSLRQQFVRLGQSRGDFVQVLDGLKEGDQIVTSGAFKLRAGMAVKIDNTLAPKLELNPKPSNS
ncbi:MAG: efflux RND transporter periplasmic adaptor subunit [Burkholderiaceae bacterium]